MLETIREYALEHLERERGGRGRCAAATPSYFLALAEAAEPELVGARAAEWLERLEAEHDNLRAALGWLLEHDAERLLAPGRGGPQLLARTRAPDGRAAVAGSGAGAKQHGACARAGEGAARGR